MAKELTALQKINPRNIIGREDDLKNLREQLAEHQQVVVVNGIGGIGKTTLAAAYVFQYYQDYEHIIWIRHESPELADNFIQNANLLRHLGLDKQQVDPKQLFPIMMDQLRNLSPSPNLLIIDNTIQGVERYFSQLPSPPNWHLLMTSREKIQDVKLMNLSYLNQENAIALFKKHCKTIQDKDLILEVISSVDHHTLTIELLAKTAQAQGFTNDQLRNALPKDTQALIRTRHSDQDIINNITDYLISIFDLSGLSDEEIDVLKQFTCLPREFHSFDLLEDLLTSEEEKKENLKVVLNSLGDKGWLLQRERKYEYQMHQIIHLVVAKTKPNSVEDVQILLGNIIQKLKLDQSKENPIDKFLWIPFGDILENIFKESSHEEIAVLQSNLAIIYKYLGDYQGAKKFAKKSMYSMEENFGLNHSKTAFCYSNLGIILDDLGDYRSAKEILQKAISIYEKRYGEDHITTATCYSNLANVLRKLGDYKEAKILVEKSLFSFEKNYGIDHPHTAIRYSILGIIFKTLGDFKSAKKFLEKALFSDQKNFKEDHPRITTRYSNLAVLYQNLGDYQEAKILLEKILLLDKKNFGESHPFTAHSYSILARNYYYQNDLKTALKLKNKAYEIDKKTLPENHPYRIQRESDIQFIKQAIETQNKP
ncbi:MAG: tetratricopeptide repeat protein [Saprospiraceae bacterium]